MWLQLLWLEKTSWGVGGGNTHLPPVPAELQLCEVWLCGPLVLCKNAWRIKLGEKRDKGGFYAAGNLCFATKAPTCEHLASKQHTLCFIL